MMQDTCEKEKCKIWQLLDGHCPNKMESSWLPPPTVGGPAVTVTDCAPRRILIMLQELSNRLVGVQAAQEQQRNENVWVQVVAEVLGKNSGIDLSAFVEQRRKLARTAELRKISGNGGNENGS